jgi:hypothetical protein
MECKNVAIFEDADEICSHLIHRGFMKDYLVSVKHGEVSSAPFAKANTVLADGRKMDDKT